MALIETTFRSYTLKRSVTFSALIPADRDFKTGEETRFQRGKFRTLYLLHGYSGDHHDFMNLTDISQLSDSLGLAIIFPDGENSFYLEDSELGTSHSAYIGKELVELTRIIFPLSERREDTFIGGISMGAYGAVINGLRYTEIFSRIISMSGAFIELEIADRKETFSDGISNRMFQQRIFGEPSALRQSDKDPRFLIEQLLNKGRSVPQMYQVCGLDDFLIGVNRTLHEFLMSRGVNHVYCEDSGVHDWDFWRKHLEKSLEWLMEHELDETDTGSI